MTRQIAIIWTVALATTAIGCIATAGTCPGNAPWTIAPFIFETQLH